MHEEWTHIELTDEQQKELGVPGMKSLPINKELLKRLVQEEIWAQTVWPDDEPSTHEILHIEGII